VTVEVDFEVEYPFGTGRGFDEEAGLEFALDQAERQASRGLRR